MNPMDLFVLSRRLNRLAVEAMPTDELAPSSTSHALVKTVAADLQEHAPTTVTQIVERTEFSQSQVSEAVRRLRSAGVVVAEPDPHDGRRTRLTTATRPSRRARQTAETSISEVLELHFASDAGAIERLLGELRDLMKAHEPSLARPRSGATHLR